MFKTENKNGEIITPVYLELLKTKGAMSSILQYLQCSCGYNKSNGFMFAVRWVQLDLKDKYLAARMTDPGADCCGKAEESQKAFTHKLNFHRAYLVTSGSLFSMIC